MKATSHFFLLMHDAKPFLRLGITFCVQQNYCSNPPFILTPSLLLNFRICLSGPPPFYLALDSIRICWRFLATELENNVQNFESIVRCACSLHNIIIKEEGLQIKDYEKMSEVVLDSIKGLSQINSMHLI